MYWPILLLLQLCGAKLLRRGLSTPPSIRQLCQFPNPTWIENIAVRSNGQLLVTLFSSPELYQIDPFHPNPTPELLARFPSALGILGIAELEEDVFAITKGNFSSETGNVTPASFSVWKADLRKRTPRLSSIADVPAATILNGASTVKQGSKFIILADSMAGVLWRVNLETAEYDVILNSTATQPTAPFPVGWGANGVHVKDGVLFFTNSDRGLYRVPIHHDGTLAGKVEVVANFTGADDFALDTHGEVYVSRGRDGMIGKVTSWGDLVTLDAANADARVLLEGNTAVAFGRTTCDKRTLYVVTNGGWSGLVPGTAQVGGRILAINLEE